MEDLQILLDNNARWAERVSAEDPDFFRRLVNQQSPAYLWIGCSDSRVPANEIVGLQPGELFVHRNIANVVPHSDVNCQSVIQFAVDVLKVRHIMVVGHYGCSGVHAALHLNDVGGIADHWLGHVRDVAEHYHRLLEAEPNDHRRHSLLCELNVLEQAMNVCGSTVVRQAWRRGQPLSVHGWIYRLGDGRVRHLDISVSGEEGLAQMRDSALHTIRTTREHYYRVKAAAAR
jgi:carbonic anhydrase